MTCKSPMASYLLKLEQMVSRTHIRQIFTRYSQVIHLRITSQNFLNCPRQVHTHVRAQKYLKMLEQKIEDS